jgi:ABC-type dipeptide/oligopeptide/nickel transport system permease component
MSLAREITLEREEKATFTLLRHVAHRLAWAIPTLIFISFVTFTAGELAPRDAAVLLAGEHGTQEQVERIREQLGLNRPFLVRFGEYVLHAARLDLGNSLFQNQEPVTEILFRGLRYTGVLALLAIALAGLLGITLGTIGAVWHNRLPDRIATTFSTLGICIPNFVLAPVLVYVFAIKLNILPVAYRESAPEGPLPYLILPVVILAMRPAAVITRLTRASMIETLSKDYVRMALAKGMSFSRVVLRHALRSSLVPVVTAIGTSFGFLLTGSFIIETAFTIPGLGLTSIKAIQQSDYPVIQGSVLLFAFLFILVNLIIDLMLPLLDPRIRQESAA